MNTSSFEFRIKNDLTSSEYTNLFGDPFWGEAGSLKARTLYLQLSGKEKALMLKANYIKMIEKARERNFNMAADNLQWWLDGTGSTKNIDFNWLRKQREVIAAENVNIERFEKDEDSKFGLFLLTLVEEKAKHFSTYYDKLVRAGIFGELYYASGNSTLSSKCSFKITKKNNNYILSGEIIHSWNDRYDWHKGASAYIYGFGNIGDSDALLVEKYCGAKPFEMRSEWKQNFNKTFQFNSARDLSLKLK
ncbi:hypothetical protein [Flavobacterium chilense]|uniref:Uncharacterized protein n=1 Tax=Flavobacterium chilense TaxID=946677 RepID=A0A1M7K827_9FLAO|nr:hypothetical protein [Flavobacterium chilense]SHM61452.1 hypothetical protein SAMN05444484_107233 [Flavobacterium chilense]